MEKFIDVFDDCTSKARKIPKEEYLLDGKYIIIDQGQNEIAGYTNIEDGIFTDVPAIVFGDHTRVIKYVDSPFFLGADGVKLLKTKKSNQNYKYLYYALRNAKIPNTGYNRHFKWLKEVQIPCHDVTKQKEIVTILDKLNLVICQRKEELELLDNLIKARFVEMFGDFESNSKQLEIETLGQLGFWSSGGTPSRTNPDYFTGDINWYSAGELNSLFLDESVEKITKEAINNSAAKLFKAGSMLVGMYDTAAFKMGILKEDSASNQACACIEPNERIDIVWLYYALTMMKNHYLSQRRGVRQKNLNLGMIKGFKLPIAQKNEQLTFVSFVKQIDKSKVAVQKSLEETQLLFDKLMQEYFG